MNIYVFRYLRPSKVRTLVDKAKTACKATPRINRGLTLRCTAVIKEDKMELRNCVVCGNPVVGKSYLIVKADGSEENSLALLHKEIMKAHLSCVDVKHSSVDLQVSFGRMRKPSKVQVDAMINKFSKLCKVAGLETSNIAKFVNRSYNDRDMKIDILLKLYLQEEGA